jgi:hypothetical protein
MLDVGEKPTPSEVQAWLLVVIAAPGSDVRVTPLATMAQSVDQLRATTQPLVVFVFCFRPESARFVRLTFHVERPAASRSRSGW